MSLQVTVVCGCLYLHVDVVGYATYFCSMLVLKSCFACGSGCLFAVWVACMYSQPTGLATLQQTVACVLP
jgi:hypothetical protein